MMKKYNLGLSVILILVGSGMFYYTREFPFVSMMDVGSGFFPRILGGLLIFLSVLLIIDTLLKPDTSTVIEFTSAGMKRVLIMFGILAAYCLILHFAGFWLATGFLVPATAYLIGERNKKRLALITVGMLVFVYVVFEAVLHTTLPQLGLLYMLGL